MKELIQNDVNPENIFNSIKIILNDKEILNKLKNDLSEIKRKLNTQGNPSKKAAEIIYSELNAFRNLKKVL